MSNLELQNVIVRQAETKFLYWVSGSVKRRIIHPQVIHDIQRKFGKDEIRTVENNILKKFSMGAIVPREWKLDDWISPPDSKPAMREIIVSRLPPGRGIEFGAGSRPLPLPIECVPVYAEPFQSSEQYDRMGYPPDGVVSAALQNPIENQFDVENESMEFSVSAHVIEHTPNPIGAILECSRTLKSEGQMVLVVPDKNKTFDRPRDATTLEHLIADYESPSIERDLENYIDFYKNVKKFRDFDLQARLAQSKNKDIHFHVWTPATFYEMMEYVVYSLGAFRRFEIKPGVNDAKCIEFYCVAFK